MKKSELILKETIQRMYSKGLTTMSGGNLSIREAEGIWVTPAGIDKRSLQEDDMMFMTLDGQAIGKNRATSEFVVHKEILAKNPSRSAVLHAHPASILGYSACRIIPDTRLYKKAYLEFDDKVAMAEYRNPGTMELAIETARVLQGKNEVAILENHGLFIVSDTQDEAFSKMENLDFLAQIQYIAKRLKAHSHELSEAQIRAIEAYDQELKSLETHDSHYAGDKAELLLLMVQRLYKRGVIPSRGASFSVRVNEESFLLTPKNISVYALETDDMVLVSNGKIENSKYVNEDIEIHQAIYDEQPDIHAVIVSMPKHMMAYAITDEDFNTRVIPECNLLLATIRKHDFGTGYDYYHQLAKLIDDKNPSFIIKNDCFVVTGKSALQAYDRIEVAESTAEGLINAALVSPLVIMDDKAIDYIDQLREKMK